MYSLSRKVPTVEYGGRWEHNSPKITADESHQKNFQKHTNRPFHCFFSTQEVLFIKERRHFVKLGSSTSNSIIVLIDIDAVSGTVWSHLEQASFLIDYFDLS